MQFLGPKLEEVRLDLVRRLREQRKSEVARRLQQVANEIAKVLNEDFLSIRQRLGLIRAASSQTAGATGSSLGRVDLGGAEPGQWVEGSSEPGSTKNPTTRSGQGQGRGREAPNIPRAGSPDPAGERAVDPAGGEGTRPRPRGGFQVAYENLGVEEDRSRYDPNTLRILINLDHPAVKEALGDGSTSDVSFLRLSYEVAFSEYAIALGYETMRDDPEIPPDDLLYEIRTSLNRVSRSASALYRTRDT
jgi:hypothetical protein